MHRFGFLDNFLMIVFGDLIDSTLCAACLQPKKGPWTLVEQQTRWRQCVNTSVPMICWRRLNMVEWLCTVVMMVAFAW